MYAIVNYLYCTCIFQECIEVQTEWRTASLCLPKLKMKGFYRPSFWVIFKLFVQVAQKMSFICILVMFISDTEIHEHLK